MPRVTIILRDEEVEVDIHHFSVDHSVNATELEWSLVGFTEAGRSMLKLTSLEEELIEEQLVEYMYNRQDDDF